MTLKESIYLEIQFRGENIGFTFYSEISEKKKDREKWERVRKFHITVHSHKFNTHLDNVCYFKFIDKEFSYGCGFLYRENYTTVMPKGNSDLLWAIHTRVWSYITYVEERQ